MREITKENLKMAFAGESQAYMKYMIYSRKAEEEGYPEVSRLFAAIAYAEMVHAANHLNALGMIRSTGENLKAALDGETYEVEEMYPAYNTVAKLQEERQAETTTRWALEAEKKHIELYQKALKAVQEKKDIKLGSIFVCEKCGYTVEGEPPERCPICGLPGNRFRKF